MQPEEQEYPSSPENAENRAWAQFEEVFMSVGEEQCYPSYEDWYKERWKKVATPLLLPNIRFAKDYEFW